jgi:hypothetical protein
MKMKNKSARSEEKAEQSNIAPRQKKRTRRDPRQKKPHFSDFVESWGLRGRKTQAGTDAGVWEQQRAFSGVFLHPWLNHRIGWLQQAYKLGWFPYRSRHHKLTNTQQLSYGNDFDAMGRAAQSKLRRKIPLSDAESTMLRLWNEHHRMLRWNWRRLSEAMLAAAACGDVEFFEHVALIMHVANSTEDRRTSGNVANCERMAVLEAIDAVRVRWFDEHVPEGETCLTNEITFDWGEVDDVMLSNERIASLAPSWAAKDVASRQKYIERAAKSFGFKLATKRHK